MSTIFTDHPDLANLGRGGAVAGHMLDANAQMAAWAQNADWYDKFRVYGFRSNEYWIYKGRLVGGAYASDSFGDVLDGDRDAIRRVYATIREHRDNADKAHPGSLTQNFHRGYAEGCEEIFDRMFGALDAAIAERKAD
ncbi:hypothetical protein [Frankia sp. R82]|uniref:hypothetical protein n=1 Tax=Frankia sp. R82 TaxID=2950553 RepID=UPI002042E626|nr:hypothetical protein [Frankia sp. R82]MCM3886139.1 hypothetical protein [Frankia sp. R82]